METDFLEWYVSGGVTNYVGSKTLPYFGSGGVLTPDQGSSYLVYALADGRVRANKGASTVVQVTGVAVAPTWSSSANQTLAQGVATNFALVASDAVTFSVVSGALPPGLALGAGALTGTITAAGSYSATIRAHGAVIGLNSDRAFSFTVAALPVWTTSAGAQAPAPRNVAYSNQFSATNAVSFSLLSGSVPTGTTLSALGLLSGTPTTAGTYSFTIRATGAAAVAYVDRSFSVVVT
jgi:large repetitive protein